MVRTEQVERPSQIIPMTRDDFIGVLVLGGATGLLVWGIGMLLHHYVFDVYFCHGDVVGQCGSAKNYAVVAASIVGGVAALAGMVRLRAYRPLLILIASFLSVWGIVQLSWDLGWVAGMLTAVALYAIAFGAYAWIARVREFWIAAAAMFVLVILVRLALMA